RCHSISATIPAHVIMADRSGVVLWRWSYSQKPSIPSALRTVTRLTRTPIASAMTAWAASWRAVARETIGLVVLGESPERDHSSAILKAFAAPGIVLVPATAEDVVCDRD